MSTSHASRRPIVSPNSKGAVARNLDIVRRLLRKPHRILVFAVAMTLSLTLVPAAYASAPGKTDTHAAVNRNLSPTKQDPVWLQAKLAHRVWSGIIPGKGKGAKTHPTILAAPLASYPASAYVYTNGDLYAAEPGSGDASTLSLNFPGGGSYDDTYTAYNDSGYWFMCGPGAADVATFDWPLPPNDSNHTESDPLSGKNATATTTWDGTDVDGTIRVRGYLMYLAFQIHPPTWQNAGMLPQSTYLLHKYNYDNKYPLANGNYGSMLQFVQDATNYAASGENNSNWASYFYTTQWNSACYNSNHNIYPANLYNALHADIQADVAGSGVPVVVEVPLNYLPNSVGNNGVNHFVAIVGYDDNAGTYSYIDTCKGYTHCDAYYNGTTWVTAQDSPDVHTVSQSQLAAGVNAIGTNQETGDGGWVW